MKDKKNRTPSQGPFTCYVLYNHHNRRTYTGQTNNFKRRLRQHNGELKGGARSTSMVGKHVTWKPLLKVKGFRTLGNVLRFERAMKRQRKGGGGPGGRVKTLEFLMENMPRFKEVEESALRVRIYIDKGAYEALNGGQVSGIKIPVKF